MAYTYAVEDFFLAGIPQTAFLNGRGPTKGIACHWTVGNPGRAGAVATAYYFIQTASRNASYHEIWWWENKTFGVLRIVPPLNAAHSMNPASFAPNANTRRIMGDLVWDANRYAYAVSFAGSQSHLTAAMADPDFVAAAARRIKELQAQFASTLSPDPLFGHYEIQPPPNKVDWGTEFSGKIYSVLKAPVPVTPKEPEMLLRQVQQDWITKGTHEFWTEGPGLGEKKFFDGPAKIRSHFEQAIQTSNGLNSGPWRVFSLNGEGLWIHRSFIDPVPDTRVPATGWGPVTPTADTGELDEKIRQQAQVIADQLTAIAERDRRLSAKDVKADELKAI